MEEYKFYTFHSLQLLVFLFEGKALFTDIILGCPKLIGGGRNPNQV